MSTGNDSEGAAASPGREMGRLGFAVRSLFLLVVLAASVAWLVLMSSLPRIDGTLPVAGIRHDAAIARDRQGVPRIIAKSTDDAYFALGWVHAQDRMWQMELQRRVGAGRLAEIVGDAGLSNDRFMRTLGIYRLAEASFVRLDEATRAALLSYAAGVNAWMEVNHIRLPLEYTVLGFRPEPWRPADSLVWQKLMALQLAGDWHEDILRGQLGRVLDAKRMRELFPAYPADAPVTLTPEGGKALLDAIPDDARPRPASNIWIVAGNRTKTGRPMLANDPHLGFRAPILWYLAELEAPGLSLSGATVPGVPFHIIAHNGVIAWGFTATQADTIDLFVEKLAGEDAYKTPDGPRPFRLRDEIIRVRDAPDTVLTVRETRHGPVISDLAGQDLAGPGEVVSMAATLLAEPDLGLQALRRLNLARDWDGFVAAIGDLQAPVLNIGYADTAGTIGFYTAGRVPVRKSGDGSVPVRGWTNEGEWTGRVAFSRMPQARNPRSGVLVNANNKVVGDRYPHLITANWHDGYRARRILDLLESGGRLTQADMSAIQGDVTSLQAVELKDLLVGQDFGEKAAQDAARMVAEWDGSADRHRPEPLIYAAWVNRLYRAVFADEVKERFQSMSVLRPQPLFQVLTRRRHWCDDVATPEAEGCEELIEHSLTGALADLSAAWGPDMARWNWGAAHPARFDNPVLGRVPWLDRRANLEIASGGDDFTVARAGYRADSGLTRFPQNHGAGLRAVFDLANLADSRFIIATGQSGHPLSRHYASMLEAWRDNRLIRLDSEGGRSVLILAPER
ncbi:penicillin acylase family protein [Magnetospirillum sp. SS-4]|uniref:penicillin acylase family protein n=1 Tax=Magnetospirillum sp. SS-4 TaxID=2681465 RepID=UPI00137D378D|nr:penicillin acylase family protein [Magnetospirillum sp. SS-4]CAA7622302.1 Penicillin acylase-like protein [Magnetospirillum sp. SS-4]